MIGPCKQRERAWFGKLYVLLAARLIICTITPAVEEFLVHNTHH